MRLGALTLILFVVSMSVPVEANSSGPSSERNSKHKHSNPGEVPASPWSDEEVAAAKAECTETLHDIRLDFEPLPPIKQGLCGTPAPILVRSVGVDPAVEIDPPATVSCDLAKALSDWIERIQPEAEDLLGSPVVQLRASSYACRNVYNRANSRLSQHALANALDLAGFVLASGERITVMGDWKDKTARSGADGRSPILLANASVSFQSLLTSQLKSEFVQAAHENACRVFGTVLGPRANKAHRDHFHLDMRERQDSLCH